MSTNPAYEQFVDNFLKDQDNNQASSSSIYEWISEPSPYCFYCQHLITELTECMAIIMPKGLMCGECDSEEEF